MNFDPLLEGEVQVQAGASIASAASGFVILLAPRVVNSGALSSPEGQVSLESGRGVIFTRSEGTSTSIDPNLRGLDLSTQNLGGDTGDYVDNTATGTIDVPQGYISLESTLVGAVLDAGVLTSTTSVSRNGYINLQGANIQLAPSAVIAITPDTTAAAIPQDPDTLSDFKTSQIRIGDTGAAIDIGANSLIYAPNADVEIGADPGETSQTNLQALDATRVFIDSGAVIDVAGVQNVLVPASVNSIKIDPVTQNTLQDSATYRSSFLDGATVYVDPRLSGVRSDGVAWVGSPLIPAASYYQQVGLTASELMTTGGNVTIGAASTAPGTTATSIPDVIIKAGATIDISGGWRTFQAGVVQTTKLIDASGQVVNIGSADPNDSYVGIYNGFTTTQPRWGISQTYVDPILSGNLMEGQYTEGRDAGVLTIKSSVAALDGQIFADAFAGDQQILDAQPGTAKGSAFGDVRNLQGAPSQLPAGGYLDIQALGIITGGGFTGGGDIEIVGSGSYTPVPGDLAYGQTATIDNVTGILTVPARPVTSVLPTDRLNVISLNADAVSSMGLSELSVQTSGNISVASNAVVNLDAGGAFEAIAGRALTIDGQIHASSGSIDLRTADLIDSQGLGGSVLLPTQAVSGSFDITVNGGLDAAGRWANDYNAAPGQLVGAAYLGGGEITLFAAPDVAPADVVVDAIPGGVTQSTDISGSIVVNTGGILNVTGGGYVAPNGSLNLTAKGGNVTLLDETSYFQFAQDYGEEIAQSGLPGTFSGFRVTANIPPGASEGVVSTNPSAITSHVSIANGSILAHGFAGGGTFTLTAPRFTFGDSATSTGAALPLDFFSKTGFSSYDIKSYETDLIPNTFTNGLGGYNAVLATQIVTVGAGQTLLLDESLFSPLLTASQIATLRNFSTGGDLNSVLTPIIPTDAWDSHPVNLSLGGLIELSVAKGGAIEGQAGGVLTVSQLYNQGTIRIPGGSIVQSEVVPALYARALTLGVHSLSDVFTTNPDGSIDEDAPNKLGLVDLNGDVLSNAAVAADYYIYLLGNLKAGEGVRLGAGSVTDLSGEAIINPRAAPMGGAPNANFVDGTLVAGGSLTTSGAFTDGAALFHAELGDVPYGSDAPTSAGLADVLNAQPAALIDLQGASATFDRLLPQATAPSVVDPMASYGPTRIWSNGGALTLGSGGTIAGAVIQAQGGAAQAEGGTLTVLNPVLIQTDPENTRPNIFTVDTALISADSIKEAGFDTFVAQGSLTSKGNVTLDLAGAFFVTDRPQDGGLAVSSATSRDLYSPTIGSGGILTVNASYIGLDGGFQTFSTPDYGTAAQNQVRFNADAIDITGAVLFDRSVGAVLLSSSGDVRLIGVEPWQLTYNVSSVTPTNPSLVGQLAVNGDLRITAAQVYPTTGTSFSISSTSSTGRITFDRSSSQTPDTPYSAGGALSVQAAEIVQDGVVRAPIGSLILGGDSPFEVTDDSGESVFAPATQSLTLGSGSITSVSADGLVIPYGTTTDQIEWFFSPTTSNPLTAPPPAILQLAGAKINVASGSTVDLHGGGDVYAYEFISGTGGSRDVLSQYNTDAFSANDGYQYADHRQVYAIVPGLSSASVAPYDPIYSANYASLYGPGEVGMRVYLNAAPGLAAGWYTLLPAQYALLPGGMRVVQDTGAAAPPPGGAATLLDGTDVVSGYYGTAGSGAYSSTQVVFDVQSQTVFRGYSDIALTYGNKTFTTDAASSGVTTPRLPIDAGRLILAPETSLVLAGVFDTTPATGGRGSEVDISGADLDIVGPGDSGGRGAIVLTTASLSDLNAASLFIGGTRTDNADGTTSLNVTTSDITVGSGATLSAPEVLLATNGTGASLTIATGASVIATGAVTDPSTGDYLINGVVTDSKGNTTQVQSAQGGFLRVANGAQRLLMRTGLDPNVTPGALTVGGGTLQGTSVEVESSGDLLLSPGARLSATSLALGATSVTFAPSAEGLSGLVITPALQAQLSDAQQLTIQSENVLKFESGTYTFGNLSLDTPGLADADGGTVNIKSGTLEIANSSADTSACGLAGAPACGTGALAISASQIVFENGDLNTYGFGGSTTLSASQGIFADGSVSMNFGAARLALDTPFVGDRGTGLADATLPSLTLVTTGAVTITNPAPGSAFTAPDGTPGSTLVIDGRTVSVDGATLRATAGVLTINASSGVSIVDDALLETPGYSRTFGDSSDPVTESAPGGRLAIVTLSGNIDVDSNSQLSIYGGQGQAGTLILSAHAGQVIADLSTVDSGPASAGASLSLDTGGGFDLSSFATGAARGFTGAISIETGTGDLDLAAGDTLKAATIALTANGGMVQSAGTLDASGVVGGNVSLYGIDGVHLASGSLINAEADGYGVTDTRQATGGNVTLGVDGSGAITVDQGAIIDVGLSASDPNNVNRLVPIAGTRGGTFYTYVSADQGGTVTFEAPIVQQQSGGDTVNVGFHGAVNGASSIVLEGFQTWNLATVAANSAYTGVSIVDGQAVLDLSATSAGKLNFLADNGAGTLVQFIQDFDISASYGGLGGLASQANFHARPGVQLDYAGDIVLNSNWNLGAGVVDVADAVKAGLMAPDPDIPGDFYVLPGDAAQVFAQYTTLTYRVGGLVTGEPGILSLRAGGNLDLNGSITDGFFQFHDQTNRTYLDLALGGGNEVLQGYLQTSCVTGACSGVTGWNANGLPSNYIYIPFASANGLSSIFTDPAPYSAAANAPDAAGDTLAAGTGDPLGSAQLFPLLPAGGGATKAVNAWSYQLVAGADLNGAGGRPDPNPMSTVADAEATLTVAGQNVYGYNATAGTARYADTLDLGVTTSSGGTETVTASQWEEAFIAANPGVNPNAYTTIDFSSAPAAARPELQSLAAQFFGANQNQSQLVESGANVTGLTTTLALAAKFMASVSANFAQIASDYQAPRETVVRGTFYATAPTLIRTGTGNIQLAASQDIDLSNGPVPTTLDSTGNIVDAAPGQTQLGGASIYTAGHAADLGTETAVDVATGAAVNVNLAANEITTDNVDDISPEAYGYGAVYGANTGILIADPVYATGGGSVSLTAGRDVLGRRDTILESELGGVGSNDVVGQFSWIGSGAQPWMTGSIGSLGSSAVNALIDPQLFREGVGTLGGGDITVTAARNVSDLSVVATSALTTGDAADGSVQPFDALVTFGGGNIALTGANILGGRVDAASGQVAITAFGDIESDGTVAVGYVPSQANLLRLRLTNATVDITAHGSVDIQGIGALGVGLADYSQNQINLDAQGFYSADAAVSILADGPVTVANSGEDLVTAGSVATNLNQSIVYPGSFQAISLTSDLDIVTSGGNNIATAVLLYPSPTGTLRLIADGEIAPLTIAMEDASPSVLPGAFSTFATNGGVAGVTSGVSFDFPSILPNTSDVARSELHNADPTHEGDSNPNQIIAGGDITDLIFSSPKEAYVSAGLDLINTVFIGQNLSSTDITDITAGRDIIGTTTLEAPIISTSSQEGTELPVVQGNTFVIGGPGAFFLQAGRNAGPFLNSAVTDGYEIENGNPVSTGVLTWAGGIQSVGNLYNPWLPQQGASILTEFGVSKGQDFDALVNYYLSPASFASLPDYLFTQTTSATGLAIVDRNQEIYSLDLLTWLKSIASSIISTYGTSSPASKVAQALESNQSVTLPQALAVLPILSDQRLPLIPWLQLNYASLLESQFGTLNVSYQQAYDAFQILPALNQRQFLLKDVYFNELIQTSIPSSPSYKQYSRGYLAVNTLFPASLGYTLNDLSGGANGSNAPVLTGDLDLRLSTIQTDQGGDIFILGPGGEVLAGSTVATAVQASRRAYAGGALFEGSPAAGTTGYILPSDITSIPVGYEGILTLEGGSIDGFTDDDFLLNQSRLFTEDGGDIALWSSNANLNAGQGPKTSANFPPIAVTIDENGYSEINAAAGVSGAGIAAFQPDLTTPAPDVFLIAPRGTVDAGAAGVRSAGNIFVAALQVANATNFQTTGNGSISGVASGPTVNVSAGTSAAAASAAAAQAAQAASSGANSSVDSTVITVDVLGYLAGLSDSSDDEEQKRKKK